MPPRLLIHRPLLRAPPPRLLTLAPPPRPRAQRLVDPSPERRSARARWYSSSGGDEEHRRWEFDEVQRLSKRPEKGRIIIDVREPSELAQTGRIPSALSMPLTSNPDGIFLAPGEFLARFGFEKPAARSRSRSRPRHASPPSHPPPPPPPAAEAEAEAAPSLHDANDGRPHESPTEVAEVVFYCKAGVRSRTAARLAGGEGGWEGVRVGDWGGGWLEWEGKGGEVER